MKRYSNITTLKALRLARKENDKACKDAYKRALARGSALADSLSPKRMLNEMTGFVSPLIKICSLFKSCFL